MDLAGLDALRTDAGRRLLAELATADLGEAALIGTVAAARARFPADLVAAAVTQARLRRRAVTKFGAAAADLFFTADGVEQATRAEVAAHRARRFAGRDRVLDLCCGIGGDLLALGRTGLAVHGVDADPLTAAIARANAATTGLSRVGVECADVTAVDLTGWPAAFCDPARRDGRRRIFDPAAYSPPLDFLHQLAERVPATGAKLGPGVPHELLPAGTEAEWVSVAGAVKEAALWFGPLAGPGVTRRATLLPSGATLTGSGAPGEVGPVGRYLYEPDGAVIRAGLVAEAATPLDARLLDPHIAYLTGAALIPSPFCTAYEILDVFGFSLKRLRAALRARRVGTVTIKKRGSPLDPATLRRELRLCGEQSATVVLTRIAGAPTVLLVEPTQPHRDTVPEPPPTPRC